MPAHPARSLASRRRRPWLALLPLLLAPACRSTDKDSGEPEGRDSTYEIQLHSRTFTPSPGIDPATRTALAAGGRDPIHVLLQLERRPTLDEHRRLDAEEAQRVGLVQYLSADDQVAERARAVADTLCSAKPGSVQHTLALARPDLDTVAAGLDAEFRHFLEQIVSDEADRGMADFLNR